MYRSCGKRLFDLILAIPALILFSPLMVIVAVAVRWKLGAPILFRQQRPGLNGAPFTLLKFRTMLPEHNAQGNLLSEAERLTPFGQLLRNTSLDELPELINVVKGEMSLIGPRPLLMKYLDRYTPRQRRRHEVKPGITGLAQSKGRNALTWEQRFTFDVWYVDHLSWGLDLKILMHTLKIVLKREGITHETHSSMPEFSGVTGSVEQA
jgi:lipopolysaccharide/colanic/teichoic acid biosynthesis glycosyltransferase